MGATVYIINLSKIFHITNDLKLVCLEHQGISDLRVLAVTIIQSHDAFKPHGLWPKIIDGSYSVCYIRHGFVC